MTLVDAGLGMGDSLCIKFSDGEITNVEVAETIFDAATGLFLGFLGTDGVFYDNDVLSSAVDVQKQTLAKEARRANQDYAQKNIKRANDFYKNTRAETLWEYGYDRTEGNIVESVISAGGSWLIKSNDSSTQRSK